MIHPEPAIFMGARYINRKKVVLRNIKHVCKIWGKNPRPQFFLHGPVFDSILQLVFYKIENFISYHSKCYVVYLQQPWKLVDTSATLDNFVTAENFLIGPTDVINNR